MCNNKENVISIDADDVILTPVTCARIINEILKDLVFQKSLIPYPYMWLEHAVKKKRSSNEDDFTNLSAEINFQSASTAFDALDEIMKNLLSELTGCSSRFYEVVFIFGPTPFTPKEVYTIKIPVVAQGHLESNHLNARRNQQKILREIFLSETWLKSIKTPLPSTNLHVILNKSSKLYNKEFFLESSEITYHKNTLNTTISIIYNTDNDRCCDHLQVFQDEHHTAGQRTVDVRSGNVISEGTWYKARVMVKGFKDSFVNKVSVSDKW